MIRLIENTEIDRPKWDSCILQSVNSHLYGFSWYLDVVSPGWQALVQDDYISVMPLTCLRKFGIDYLAQPKFSQQLGIFCRKPVDEISIRSFLEAIPRKFKLTEINLNTNNILPSGYENGFHGLNLELSLSPSAEEIVKGYSENQRRNLRKAEKEQLSVSENIHPDDLIKLFRENFGQKVKNLRDKDYHLLKRIIYTCIAKGAGECRGVYDQLNQLCAAACFIHSRKRIVFLFAASSEQGKQVGAMSWLIHSFIRQHAGNDLILDFEGSNEPDVARFYKSFGSKETHYFCIRQNKIPALINFVILLIKRIRGF